MHYDFTEENYEGKKPKTLRITVKNNGSHNTL